MFKWIAKIFKKNEDADQETFLFPGLVSKKQYLLFESKRRMQAVIIIGDSAQVQFYEFMKWCVLQDPDLNVRLAALKRLPNYVAQSDLALFLTELDSSKKSIELEPYYSMALLRIGIINENEFKIRIDGG